MLLNADKSQLLMIDLQDRLLPAIHDGEAVTEQAAILLKSAELMAIPLTVSEQYPKGLGHTEPSLMEAARSAGAEFFDKTAFSCFKEKAIRAHIARRQERRQIILFGTEAHVCVLQSALDAVNTGYEVFVVADACSSRTEANRKLAFERMRDCGITIVSVEMVLFEWMERAGNDLFRTVSKLIK